MFVLSWKDWDSLFVLSSCEAEMLRLANVCKEAPFLPDCGGGRTLLVSECQHTLPAHVQLVIHWLPQVLLSRAAVCLFMPQPGLIPGIVLNN